MAWIPYSEINRRNCIVSVVKFVKSASKRRVVANLYGCKDFLIEADLHVVFDRRWRGWRWSKRDALTCWFSKHPLDTWAKSYRCSAQHMSVFVKNDKLYSKSKNELREFNNPWLLGRIMKLAFKGEK